MLTEEKKMIGFEKGILKVIGFSHYGNQSKEKRVLFWKALCECGNIRIISTGELNRKRVKKSSCGCLGKIKSKILMKKSRDNFFSKILKMGSGCWEWQGLLKPNGYGAFVIKKYNIQTSHRASWFIHHGQIPEDRYVLHKCDNKKCVNPDHLYLGTPKDNVDDMLERGNFPCGPNKKKGNPGEKNCKSKLDNEKVKYIKFLCENGFKKTEIAKFFHVAKETIYRISGGQGWLYV